MQIISFVKIRNLRVGSSLKWRLAEGVSIQRRQMRMVSYK